MGRKEQGKNVHILIEWFEIYKLKYPSDIKLVFIGGGDKSLIPNDSDFIDFGFVTEKEKQYLLENAISLINLSENESFSIVIMEAWLCKTPAIVHGDCKVTKGHCIRANGGLFPSNVYEFVEVLEYLNKNELTRIDMGNSGLNYVKENYTHDIVLEKYLNVLESK
jgi:glycosyltransferase involved in cell wall biosynthesis